MTARAAVAIAILIVGGQTVNANTQRWSDRVIPLPREVLVVGLLYAALILSKLVSPPAQITSGATIEEVVD